MRRGIQEKRLFKTWLGRTWGFKKVENYRSEMVNREKENRKEKKKKKRGNGGNQILKLYTSSGC